MGKYGSAFSLQWPAPSSTGMIQKPACSLPEGSVERGSRIWGGSSPARAHGASATISKNSASAGTGSVLVAITPSLFNIVLTSAQVDREALLRNFGKPDGLP